MKPIWKEVQYLSLEKHTKAIKNYKTVADLDYSYKEEILNLIKDLKNVSEFV